MNNHQLCNREKINNKSILSTPIFKKPLSEPLTNAKFFTITLNDNQQAIVSLPNFTQQACVNVMMLLWQ